MRQWDTTKIIEWLKSAEGEAWSRENHNSIIGLFVIIKDDELDTWDEYVFTNKDYNNAPSLASSV